MLKAEDIRKHLYDSAEVFKIHCRQQAWASAKETYDTTSAIAVFVELEEEDLIKLFGSRAYTEDDPPVQGLFPEELVDKAYRECIKRGQTFERMEYPGCPRAKK